MSSSKKIGLQRDFAAGVYLSEAKNPVSPPLYTLYTCIQYTYIFTQGRRRGGGGVEPKRRGKGKHRRVQIPKLG